MAGEPLEHLVQVVCPSLGRSCGVAEYTRSLCRHAGCAPVAAVRSAPPVKLLHVQHENKLYDDRKLHQDLSREKDKGTVIVVTEHTASRTRRSWDDLVDVWITHTALGYDWLTQRCPRSYVTRMPHGCPTWFPPRKTRRGTTIATFGFLARSKGHSALMDALDATPGLELLVYGIAQPPSRADAFAADYRGRAVRHVNSYLPESSVATELAALADVLVFWYDENLGTPGASGAVTVGLSTGVPVVVSPTSRFAEIRSCTYQPRSLIEGLPIILQDDKLRASLTARARFYCSEHSWREIARGHRILWTEAMA
jgi:glycosyltransferase involved in cell wall biosynthesis